MAKFSSKQTSQMNRSLFWLLLFGILIFHQCIPPTEEVLTDIDLNFKNKTLQKIYDFQDRQNLDSLYHYFRHKDPTYRYAATMAFASIKKPEALDSLYVMLLDPIEDVKVAAAYAIGQVGESANENRLIAAFDAYDTLGQSYANAAILEAIGKCGDEEMLDNLATISTYKSTDTVLLEGQAWGIYRFALREKISRKGTAKMLELTTNRANPDRVRMIAANYLYRAEKIRFPDDADKEIADAIQKEDDPRIRMALAIGLGKTKTEAALNALIYQLNVEQDYRVKCNIIRALSNFEYDQVQPTVFVALKDKSLPVALTSANFFISNGTAREATQYWRLSKDSAHWQVQLALYTAALRHLPTYFTTSIQSINWELKQRYLNSTNDYEKAGVIKALSEYGWNYNYIKQVAFPSDIPVIRTASIEAIDNICNKDGDDFRKFFGAGYRNVRKELGGYLVEAIQSGDAGMMYAAASTIAKPRYFFKGAIDSIGFLEKALEKLSLPQEIETYNEVKKALDYFRGNDESAPMTPAFNHPIEWRHLNDFDESTRVVIKTAKGEIELEMLPDVAPGTVANFLQLVKTDFYEGKNFHRVVPNFVIQGGCPRGDGFGSLDYSIRSELPYLHYDAAGYVGMASAGNHTECTQFFITHSPTPHLDGNYTIFARVSEGMEVVHQIEIGDIIESIAIQKSD